MFSIYLVAIYKIVRAHLTFKLRKYKKRHFKQTILDDLDRLRDSDPKQYWKLLNSLKDSNNDDKTSILIFQI